MAGLWGAGDYTFVLARLGPLHLGCNKEVAALLRFHCTYIHIHIHIHTHASMHTIDKIDELYMYRKSCHSILGTIDNIIVLTGQCLL